jgi:hypothetical protein
VNVDPELRKRVEQIKSSPVQLYREAGDYSNRELVEGILVSPDDIAAIEAVAQLDLALRIADAQLEAAHHRMVPARPLPAVGAVTREKGGVNRIRNQERAVAELLARIIRQTDRDAAVIITPDGWDRRRLERYLIDVVIKHASIHWITISADGSDDVWPSALR